MISFILNNDLVQVDHKAEQSLLGYLREVRRLVGSKEGCAEGDCGACTVLIGRVQNGQLKYVAMNSCIAFLPMCHGAHVVTVEALAKNGKLHWVQQALADFHGTQCGFCTPGIVMSLYAMWMENTQPNTADVEKALQGNLCRCTGYASILRGVEARASGENLKDDPLFAHRADVIKSLGLIEPTQDIPTSIEELQSALKATPDATIIAGATDVGLWVTKHLKSITPAIHIGQIEELQRIEFDENVIIGASVTYTQAEDALAKIFPELTDFWPRIAGQQVRNMGTIGGNIANGSPIGDMPPVLIAMGAQLVLNKFGVKREIALEDYFIDYGKQDREKGEFVQSLIIPKTGAKNLRVYKVSKRKDEDISSVLGALNIEVVNGKILNAKIAFGGMAATPKRAILTEEFLISKDWSETTIRSAMDILSHDFTPISDMRASSVYRMKVAQNMLLRVFLELKL